MTDAPHSRSMRADKAFPSFPLQSGHQWAVPFLLAIAMFIVIVGSLCIGAYPMSFWQAARIVAHLALPFPLPDNPPWTNKELVVIEIIRLPRVLLATFAGIALGISGTALQGMMRNPLVGPDLVGVSSGAAVGAVMAILFNLPATGIIVVAFCGGLGAMACAMGFAKLAGGGASGMALILSGIFVSAFCMSGVGLAEFLANDAQIGPIITWMFGSFAQAEPKTVWMLAIPTLIGGSLLLLIRWRLNLLSLGDVDISSLGINGHALRWVIIAIVSWIIAAQVSVSGVISWVGLIIPHCARMLVGPDHRKLLPASAMLGALFTLCIDDFTRTVLRTDVPIGVMTALIGSPLICFLFWKTQTKGWIDG